MKHQIILHLQMKLLQLCAFLSKKSLETGLRDLLTWAKDFESMDYESLYQKVTTLFSTGDFHKASSDLLPIICGQTIQMHRDSILKHAKGPVTKASLRKIPPSSQSFCYRKIHSGSGPCRRRQKMLLASTKRHCDFCHAGSSKKVTRPLAGVRFSF